jgi:YEATS domain-containing protein 4
MPLKKHVNRYTHANRLPRVKGKRITRDFIIGSEAWKLSPTELANPKNQPGATSGWRIYLRPVPNGPTLTAWLKKVTFILHETFPNAVRTVENVNPATGGFELEETAYGGFLVGVKMYFQPVSGEKWQQRSHFLQLDPYSGNEDVEKQEQEKEDMRRANMVRAEQIETIEFNEPNEALFDALTNDNQWDYLKPARAKSKSKGRGSSISKLPDYPPPPGGEYAANLLPDRPLEQGHVYSKETEDLLVDTLDKASAEAEAALLKTLTRSKEVNEFTEKMKEGQDVDEKLRMLFESLPAKKK